MEPTEHQVDSAAADRRTLLIALAANVAMFAVGVVGWRIAQSTALLADAFDMLADATGYAVAYWAVGRSRRVQVMAARWNGSLLIALGLGVLGEVLHRWFVPGEPIGGLIVAFAVLSLAVNGSVLRLQRRTAAVSLKQPLNASSRIPSPAGSAHP